MATTTVDRQEFLDVIFQGLGDDEHVCVSRAIKKKEGKGSWFKSYLVTARQWRKWKPDTQAQAWYFCVSTVNGELNAKGTMVGRGRAQLVRAYCLVLDDIGTKADPPPVAPSWKLESSPGNFQWGYLLDPTSDFDRFEALVEHCHQQGWGDAGAGGSYRLMRVPGSANLKPGRQQFRSLIEMDAEPPVWSLDELAEDLGCDFSKVTVRDTRSVTDKTGGATTTTPSLMDGIDPLLDHLVDAGLVVQDKGEWIDVICPWAETHTTGDNLAGYSPLGRGSGDWVQTRAFKCLHEHCRDHRLKDFIKKVDGPKVSGYDPLPWLQARYVYVVVDQRVADIEQRLLGGDWLLSFSDWANQHKGSIMVPGHDRPVDMSRAYLESSGTKKAMNTRYDPTSSDWRSLAVGQTQVNTYIPPNWPETDPERAGDCPQIFLDHVHFLFAENAEMFLDWLAWKFQNPDKRSWVVVCVAEATFGVGRSWLRKALSSALQGHVRPVTLGQLIGKGSTAEQNYNDWGVACQFVVVEEAKDTGSSDDFYKGYETFKQVCDNTIVKMRTNPKYGKTREESLWFNTLIFTNHDDAMIIPEGDRRIAVFANPTVLKDEAYYQALHDSLDDGEGQRMYWWLMRRDVSSFGHVYPPDTPAKLQMMETSRSPADEIMDLVLEGLTGDLVTRDIIRNRVRECAYRLGHDKVADKPGGVAKHIWLKFGNLRGKARGARYTIKGVQTEIRAIRSKVEWTAKDMNRDIDALLLELQRNMGAEVVDVLSRG